MGGWVGAVGGEGGCHGAMEGVVQGRQAGG